MTLDLDDRVTALPGLGPKAAARLADAFEIRTVRDLLGHHPRRWHDAGEVLDLAEVREGQPATLLGEVLGFDARRIPAGRKRPRPLDLVEGRVRQASGAVFRVTFFNQRWRAKQLSTGTVAAFSGEVTRFRGELQLASPDVQVLGRITGGADLEAGAARLAHQRLLAVYPATASVPSFRLSNYVEAALGALPTFEDWLPRAWRDELDLVDLDDAWRGLHLPPDHATLEAARRRLVFDELFALQLGLQWRRAALEADTVGLDNSHVLGGWAQRFLDVLPFAPTGAQARAMGGVGDDLASHRPMHRLLQGDVGSGKTLVAVWAMLCAVDQGRQAALMVPTEVLAEQHHRTLSDLLAPLGVNVLDGLRVELLTSSSSTATRRRVLGELLTGEVDIVVGTHALLEEGVRFAELGVVVIDEQHRFGVSQRVQLKEKVVAPGAGREKGAPGAGREKGAPGAGRERSAPGAGRENESELGHGPAGEGGRDVLPDVLVMTATPIPRSLALTIYGDLDVTVLDELPPGRHPIRTTLITPAQEARRDKVYAFVRSEAAAGRRAFVVCPLVEPSDAVPATAAVDEHARLAREVFAEFDVELVHGRLRPDDKEAAMRRFRTGEAQVLVCTTVIEVGVDVPEASVMIVEDAERFGISQLHQLRGRVGRGTDRSHCVLFAGWRAELTDDARDRLEAVAASTDGVELAEEDLRIRGYGKLFGRSQSGESDLALVDPARDQALIGLTRDRARAVIAADPDLSDPTNATLRAEVLRRYSGGLEELAALETG